jgi:Uma2 family endonuclease
MNRPKAEKISLANFLAWEQAQSERHEWIDGTVVPCAGVSFEHATISTNLNAIFRSAVNPGPCFVQPSDRQLVPRNSAGENLGSFYADLFVSCAPEDRTGRAAHFPKIVVEILSAHAGDEFTRKKDAYLGSAVLTEYIIVDSTRRYVVRYAWKEGRADRPRLVTAEYRRGPVPVPTLGLTISFDEIYDGTTVPAILHPISPDDIEDSAIVLD